MNCSRCGRTLGTGGELSCCGSLSTRVGGLPDDATISGYRDTIARLTRERDDLKQRLATRIDLHDSDGRALLRLTRERDGAAVSAAILQMGVDRLAAELDGTRDEVERLTRERDEARAQRDHYRERCGGSADEGVIWTALENATRERDEARALVDRYRTAIDDAEEYEHESDDERMDSIRSTWRAATLGSKDLCAEMTRADAAEAEVERLQAELARCCEQGPWPSCDCRGCSTMRALLAAEIDPFG